MGATRAGSMVRNRDDQPQSGSNTTRNGSHGSNTTRDGNNSQHPNGAPPQGHTRNGQEHGNPVKHADTTNAAKAACRKVRSFP